MDTPTVARDYSPKLYLWLFFASLVGLYGSAQLVLEKISFWQQTAEGTSPALGCDINPVVGCGPIINTDQASIFWDIPNPLIGVVAFAALLALAVVLGTGVKLPEWIWGGLQAGVIFGVSMATYLQYSSIYVLHGLCPYCMLVWAVMVPTFWLVTARNLREWTPGSRLSAAIYNWTPLWLSLHVLAILACIWFEFGTRLWA